MPIILRRGWTDAPLIKNRMTLYTTGGENVRSPLRRVGWERAQQSYAAQLQTTLWLLMWAGVVNRDVASIPIVLVEKSVK
jgi:hypothetical protein